MSAHNRQASNETAFRSALSAALNSEKFRSSPKLSAFLTYVVERTVEGEAEKIKGYAIAVDALGLPETFDSDSDPTVRVIAGRVRKALVAYYENEGKANDHRIHLPVGSYVPQLRALEDPDPLGERVLKMVPEWLRLPRKAAWALAFSSYTAAILLITVFVMSTPKCNTCFDSVPDQPVFESGPDQSTHLHSSLDCS